MLRGMGASGEWAWIQREKQADWISALRSEDQQQIEGYLRGFFRNEAGYGLVSFPYPLTEQSVSALRHDIEVWDEFCDSPPVARLRTPDVGEPYGLEADGVLIVPDAPRHYYNAARLLRLEPASILEIGGGYGGVYYFLRQLGFAGLYINCDLESTLAVWRYYVTHSVGEKACELVSSHRRDAIRAPVDVVCNFHSWSEMSRADLEAYFALVRRIQPRHIFHCNANRWLWK